MPRDVQEHSIYTKISFDKDPNTLTTPLLTELNFWVLNFDTLTNMNLPALSRNLKSRILIAMWS